jgi:MFS family permease
VVGLLGSLLVVGALSDHVGRRPVLGAAIALETVALVLFLFAENVVALSAARLLQGIATGAAVTTLGAALVDLEPAHAVDGRPSSTRWHPPPGSRSAPSAAAPSSSSPPRPPGSSTPC